jgi:hypothetical protein
LDQLERPQPQSRSDWFPQLWVYLGFLTTAISVPAAEALFHRFAYVVYLVLFLYFALRKALVLNKQVTFGLLLLLAFSFISVAKGLVDPLRVLRSFSGLMLLQLGLFSYFAYYDYDYRRVFRHYLIIARLVAAVGLFQEVSYIIHFEPGWDLSWLFIGQLNRETLEDLSRGGPLMRISSFFSEPGYLAAALSPAVFLAINCFATGNRTFFTRAQALLVLCAMFLTFSFIGYCGVAISLMFHLHWRQWRRALLPMLVIGAVGWWVVSSVDFFRSRAEGLWISVVTQEVTGSENASSLIYAMNGEIARQNLLERPLTGSGYDSFMATALGALDRMGLPDGFLKFVSSQDVETLMFADGSTMYFRVLTEFGLVGAALILLFFYVYRVRGPDPECKLLQKMCIVFLLTYSLRTGQYIRFELWYFIALYCCLKQYGTDAGMSAESYKTGAQATSY